MDKKAGQAGIQGSPVILFRPPDSTLTLNCYLAATLRRVKYIERKRIIIAWMLFLTLTPFFLVKTFHKHEAAGCSVCSSGTAQNCNEVCLICQFTFLPFTQAEPPQFFAPAPVRRFEPESRTEKALSDSSCSYGLRAPPISA